MIAIEDAIPLLEVAELLPRRNGKKIHFSTLWRWVVSGAYGVRLETISIGRRLCTSRKALQRFCGEVAQRRLEALRTDRWRRLSEARQGGYDYRSAERYCAANGLGYEGVRLKLSG